MNNFKESLKVEVERNSSGKIIITENLKNILIELMKGNISKKEVIEVTGIGDKDTVERKVEEIVLCNPELEQLYKEYLGRKSSNFNGYTFRIEVITMLRRDYSQSEMAEHIKVSRRTFSTKVNKLKEENKDNILGKLLLEHAERKMNRQKITDQELVEINLKLDKYEEQYPVTTSIYENRSSKEIRLESIENVLRLIDNLKKEGMTLEEIFEKGIISESSYRKYKKEADNLIKLLNGKNRNEE